MDQIYTFREYLTSTNQVKVTCYSCDWSIDTINGLECRKWSRPANKPCDSYIRAMGADEPEEVNGD